MDDGETLLWCIHGNLQLPSVWNTFDKLFSLPLSKDKLRINNVNLWADRTENFQEWSRCFRERIGGSAPAAPQLLMGYSLGGRLAWHAILEDPGLWRGAVIIAAHPGLDNSLQRQQRLRHDEKWARRFREEPWDGLIRDWDAQPVFAGISSAPPRKEQDFDRAAIARLFDIFSTGRQDPLMDKLRKLQKPPILFVSGERDEKYGEIGQELARRVPVVKHVVIERAGHRVPWENRDNFIQVVQQFIDTL